MSLSGLVGDAAAIPSVGYGPCPVTGARAAGAANAVFGLNVRRSDGRQAERRRREKLPPPRSNVPPVSAAILLVVLVFHYRSSRRQRAHGWLYCSSVTGSSQ